MTTADYLEQLQADLAKLKQDAKEAGIEVSDNDTFTTIATKFEGVGGGGDLSEYYTETIQYGNSSTPGYVKTIKKLPVYKIDPNNPGSTAYMFYGFQGTSLDLSQLDTSQVFNMSNMFCNCYNITELDLSNFYTTKVTNMSSMFNGCYMLQKVDIRNFTFDSVTNSLGIFSNLNNPGGCLIIVKSETEKAWLQSKNTSLTNIKTVEEYENS